MVFSPFSSTTCWPWDPWLTQPGRHVQLGHASLDEDANSDRPGSAPCGPPHQRWRRDALQPPEVPRSQLPQGHVCPPSDRRLAKRLMEHERASWISQTSREQKQNYLRRLTGKTTSYASRTRMGKTSSYKLFKHNILIFECLVLSFQTTYKRKFHEEDLHASQQ